MTPKRFIGVIGGGSAAPDVLETARDVGAELARAGFSLVCGGLFGVMEAACRGHAEGREERGGDSLTLGLLPGTSADDGTAYLDIAIPTGIGIARNLLVVRSAKAIIVIDGSSGTLSELAFAWQLGLPIVALAPTGGIAAEYAGRPVDSKRDDTVMCAVTAREAVELVCAVIE